MKNNSNLLVDTTTFVQKNSKDKDDGEAIYSFEGYYQCLKYFVSKIFLKNWFLNVKDKQECQVIKRLTKSLKKSSWRSDEMDIIHIKMF